MNHQHRHDHGDAEPTDAEREAMREEEKQRLIDAFLDGEDRVFSRAKAAMYLGMDFPDAFPIHVPEEGRWIVSVETDSFDGRMFVSNRVDIYEDGETCPECENERVEYASFDNGVIGGFRKTCTVCGYCHAEDAG